MIVETKHTLWRWSRQKLVWQMDVIGVPHSQRKATMKANKRRSPLGTIFRWRTDEEGPPAKRPFKRAAKEIMADGY